MPRLSRPAALAALALLTFACPAPALDDVIDEPLPEGAEPPPPEPAGPALIEVGPELLDHALPLSDELRVALASRKHAAAAELLAKLKTAELRGDQVPELAFLQAWTALRRGKGAEAVHLIEVVQKSKVAPADYRELTVAELLMADGRHVEALPILHGIPLSSINHARARLLAAEAHQKLGATKEAEAEWKMLAERADPAEGSQIALWALAQKRGLGSAAAHPYLMRLYSYYPTSREGRRAEAALKQHYPAKEHQPGDVEYATRADRLMDAWRYKDVTDLVGAQYARWVTPDADACMAWYAFGRSHFKRNNITKAAEVLSAAAPKCQGVDDERGPKMLYIAGKALERKKAWSSAAAAYEKIPALFPEHSMADDGYALAGVARQIAGSPAAAMTLWEKQVTEYPDGDLAAEGFWRLAWNHYLQGNPRQAIQWAERMLEQVEENADPVHYNAARYWSARWRVYPNVKQPTVKNTDAAAVAEGIELWAAQVRERPTRFYSLLAASRLYELAPEKVRTLQRPTPVGSPTRWNLREEYFGSREVQRAAALGRLGLAQEALAELKGRGEPREEMLPSEVAWETEFLAQSDPITAHDKLHKYLLHRVPESLGEDRDRILMTAYPNTWWELIQDVGKDLELDVRIFHALVREESSFNPAAKSWAGARGLSQLMPATARHWGGRLGLKVTDSTMVDPRTNTTIGSAYLDYLRRYFDGNMFMAVPAYNAGEGNVGKWSRGLGPVPTDEYIEHIPLRETRHYVKRVLGTYQLYRVVWGEGPLYPDWSAHNHVSWKG
jgi:soluble lytic murein transglycosylase